MFSDLDEMVNLRCLRQQGEGGHTGRRVVGGCNDAVTDLLAGCQSPSHLAQTAHRFGIPSSEIRRRATSAGSFAQFRLSIGNRIRGIVRRLDRSRRQGRAMSLREAAKPPRSRAGWGPGLQPA